MKSLAFVVGARALESFSESGNSINPNTIEWKTDISVLVNRAIVFINRSAAIHGGEERVLRLPTSTRAIILVARHCDAVNRIKMKFKFKLPAQDKSNKSINTSRVTTRDAINGPLTPVSPHCQCVFLVFR